MKKNEDAQLDASGVSRREFGKRTVIGFVGGALAASARPASTSAAAVSAVPPFLPQEQATSGLSSQALAEVEAKVQHVIATYGSRLSDDQKKRLRQIISSHVRMLEAVRPIPTANGDAPATVLKLIRGSNGDDEPAPAKTGLRDKPPKSNGEAR
jgi:hypothetical protein